MLPTNIPLYLNWSFWTVVIATIAVILSQLPPLHILFKKARLDFDLYSKISITHRVGNPNIQLHLVINNIGGRKVKIKELSVEIERNNKLLVTFPAQNYEPNKSDKSNMLFTTFSINPSDDWAHIVNFLNFFDLKNEKEYREIEGKMLVDYREKRFTESENSKNLIELDAEIVNLAHTFFEKHNIWIAGEYSMKVCIVTDFNSANIIKSYRFTLFESQAEQLISTTDNYKFGAGIWWDTQIIENVVLQISKA